MRDQSIIIHGVHEKDRDDRQYLTKLFDILEMGHTNPLTAHRLGMKKYDRQRPLRVTMETLDKKMEFMSKLGLLSGPKKDFKNRNVNDNYTFA